MKDHSHWYGPAGEWQSNQRFHAILPFLSCTRTQSRAVVSVSLINLPLSHDWRDQHVLIILSWFELDQHSVQLHKHSTSERDKHSASAPCILKEVQGHGKSRSGFSVCLSVWVLPESSCEVCLVQEKDIHVYKDKSGPGLSDRPQQCRHKKTGREKKGINLSLQIQTQWVQRWMLRFCWINTYPRLGRGGHF